MLLTMMMENGGSGGDSCSELPKDFIVDVLALTSPRDACRLSLVASTFRSAAESDAVWERFLPADYEDILARAVLGYKPPPSASKKDLYLWLSDDPLPIDHGTKSFYLEKPTGRKCYILSPGIRNWPSPPQFSAVAPVASLCWSGKISTRMLSPETTYAAFMVFKPTAAAHGFEWPRAEVAMGISGCELRTRIVYLDPAAGQRYQNEIVPMGAYSGCCMSVLQVPQRNQCPNVREDGWMEIELGEYFNEGGEEERELKMSVWDMGSGWKTGIIIKGIDIRPKIDP